MLAVRCFAVLFLALLVVEGRQAPGDEDPECLAASGELSNSFAPTSRSVLMDSYGYQDLIGGVGSAWQTIHLAGAGAGWSQTSSQCPRSVQVCDLADAATPPQQWIVTQTISFLSARAVHVEIMFTFTDCSDSSFCTVTSFDVLVYQTNTQSTIEGGDLSSFDPAFTVTTDQQSPANFSFYHNESFNFFHLGILDSGACISISRVLVYYVFKPPTDIGLVMIPEVALPLAGSEAVSVLAECADNSTNVTSLEVSCNANGECSGSPQCACDSGFEFVPATSQCRACPSGTTKMTISNEDFCVSEPVTVIEYVTNIIPVAVLGALLGAAILIIFLLVAIIVALCKRNNTSSPPPQAAERMNGQDHANRATTVETQMVDITPRGSEISPSASSEPSNTTTSLTHENTLDHNTNDTVVVPVTGATSSSASPTPPSEDVASMTSAQEPQATTDVDADSFKDAEDFQPPEGDVEISSRPQTTSPPQAAAVDISGETRSGSILQRAKRTVVGVASAMVSKMIPTFNRSDSEFSGDPSAANEGGGFTLV